MPEKKKRTLTAAQRARKAKLRRRRKIRRIAWRSVLTVLTIIVLLLAAVLSAGYAAFRGPSRTMGDLLTVSLLETSALKFVPRIYYSEAEVQQIVKRNQLASVEEETDTSLIVIAPPTPEPTPVPEDAEESPAIDMSALVTPVPTDAPIVDEDGIKIYEVHGGTYNGYMMIVQDPSRVSVGTSRDSFNSKPGLQLHQIAERYDAVAAINGGAFHDDGGGGNGGQPGGLVIADGKLLNKADKSALRNIVVGFNEDDILIFGEFSGAQAKERNMRDCVTFGPVLVANGEPVTVSGSGSGLNPRTAIGQRADGAVLMLVIDGRQANSIGASYADLIKVMLDYDAVNAVNLDGGSSSMLYYQGEYLNNGVVLTGSRKLPTSFIVR
ncbi:MAG: phosphodiester glycosidase family protein [Clostridia bacterium]|nr:phosphodiester glycosidase family protein [Clostridia bacterium]MBP3651477.1 phosphodiester glycosidase family protein [Clostridia bacterium]